MSNRAFMSDRSHRDYTETHGFMQPKWWGLPWLSAHSVRQPDCACAWCEWAGVRQAEREARRILGETEPPEAPWEGAWFHEPLDFMQRMAPDRASDALISAIRAILPVLDELEQEAINASR